MCRFIGEAERGGSSTLAAASRSRLPKQPSSCPCTVDFETRSSPRNGLSPYEQTQSNLFNRESKLRSEDLPLLAGDVFVLFIPGMGRLSAKSVPREKTFPPGGGSSTPCRDIPRGHGGRSLWQLTLCSEHPLCSPGIFADCSSGSSSSSTTTGEISCLAEGRG